MVLFKERDMYLKAIGGVVCGLYQDGKFDFLPVAQ